MHVHTNHSQLITMREAGIWAWIGVACLHNTGDNDREVINCSARAGQDLAIAG